MESDGVHETGRFIEAAPLLLKIGVISTPLDHWRYSNTKEIVNGLTISKDESPSYRITAVLNNLIDVGSSGVICMNTYLAPHFG